MLGIERTPVRDSKRFMGDRVANRAPDVDDTYARFEKAFSVGAEMAMYTSDAGIECLVDVDALLQVSSQVKVFDTDRQCSYHWTPHGFTVNGLLCTGPTPEEI